MKTVGQRFIVGEGLDPPLGKQSLPPGVFFTPDALREGRVKTLPYGWIYRMVR